MALFEEDRILTKKPLAQHPKLCLEEDTDPMHPHYLEDFENKAKLFNPTADEACVIHQMSLSNDCNNQGNCTLTTSRNLLPPPHSMQDLLNHSSSTSLQDSSSIKVEATHVMGPHDNSVGTVFNAVLICTSCCQYIRAVIVK